MPPASWPSRDRLGVGLEIEVLAACRDGVELAPLVTRLATFPNPEAWSAWLRRAIVPLADGDGDLLAALLVQAAAPYPDALGTYGLVPESVA